METLRSLRFLLAVVVSASVLAGGRAADAQTVVNLSNHAHPLLSDSNPRIEAERVVFNTEVIFDSVIINGIALWDGTATSVVVDETTPPVWQPFQPVVSAAGRIVWSDKGHGQPMLTWYDGVLSAIGSDGFRSSIFGTNVVFDLVGDLYLWDGATTVPFITHPDDDREPDISGDSVVWVRDFRKVYLWDGSNESLIADQEWGALTPRIDAGNVAWIGDDDGTGREIFFWDGSDITQITSTGREKYGVSVSGSRVVWGERDGSAENDAEIYLWDGSGITALTDNTTSDDYPDISGNRVVWEAGREIYLMELAPDDVPALGAGGAVGVAVAVLMAGLTRIRRLT